MLLWLIEMVVFQLPQLHKHFERWAQQSFPMLTKMTVLISSLLITISAFSQDLTDSTVQKTISLLSKVDIKPKKRIILSNNNSFTVYSTIDLTVENLKKFIVEHDIEEDKELRGRLFNTAKSFERNMQDIKNDPKLKRRLEFRTVDLLEQGKCIVYNKISKTYVSQVLRTKYIKEWWTGIRFSTLDNQTIIDIRTGAF